MDKLTSLINDLNRAAEIRKQLNELSTKTNDPVIEIITYALNNNIISSSTDILKISRNVPDDIANLLAKKYDEKNKNSFKKNKNKSSNQYAGVYKSLDELNAKFGTNFNYRCSPGGVVIYSREC